MFFRKFPIAVFCVLILFPSTQIVWALDWKDSEWRDRGCPEGLKGIWKAETASPLSGQEIEFRTDGTFLIVRKGRDIQLTFKGNLQADNRRFIDLEIKSGSGDSYPAAMKIRPHLGPANDSHSSTWATGCRIKVFRYENQLRARQNREHSWDIYHLKK